MKIAKIIFFFLVFFILGGVNEKAFQAKAKKVAQSKIIALFNNRYENVIKLSKPDYSLGQIEIIVSTVKSTYFVVASDRTPLLMRYSALNYFTKPKVIILSVEKK